MSNEDVLTTYAELKLQIASLEEAAKAIYPKVLKEMEGQKFVESDLGRFSTVSRKKWTYSDKVMQMTEDLKLEKIEEEENGVASCEVTQSVTFKPTKL